MAERMTALYDASKCTGCKGCVVACKQWQGLAAEKTSLVKSYQSHRGFSPRTWTFVSMNEVRENNKTEWLFRKEQCMHCSDAACEKACNSGAISRTGQGFVVINRDRCIGCGYCAANCPFGVPRVDAALQKSFKCNGCPDRVENGLQPACAQGCQCEALVFGKRSDILALAAERVKRLQAANPKANIYNAPLLGGLNFTYILLREPAFYGLPANPAVPASLGVWKDFVRPFGGIAVAGALLATAVGFLKTRGQGRAQQPPQDGKGAKLDE